MTTPWYYDYYEKGSFPHQEQLCKAVEWIPECNLEGRLLKAPGHLTVLPTNPLTLQLRALNKALEQLEHEVYYASMKIRENINAQLNANTHVGMGGKLHTQDSKLATGGAAIEEININGIMVQFHHDNIYYALFDFFTYFCSILDRLALEINLLYKLGDWISGQLDWNKITNPNEDNEFFALLQTKDQKLADFIKNQRKKIAGISSYRNRLLHDGIIRTEIETPSIMNNFRVCLPQNPNKQATTYDKDAIEFCEKRKASLLKLLDESYRLMLQHIKTNGKPPW